MFAKGTKMFWPDGTPAYEKLNDEDFGLWVSLDSKYLVERLVDELTNEDKNHLVDKVGKKFRVHELRNETDRPLYNEQGKLNRLGFKWTDKQVKEYFTFMSFKSS
jgi:hypothetical protein